MKRSSANSLHVAVQGGGVTISDSAPTDAPGDGGPFMYFNTSNNTLYFWYNDTWNVFSGGGASIFGVTTDNPPVSAPVGDDPVVLINLSTGIIYYWNASWLVANDGGTDTNAANSNLTADNNRTHNWAGFGLTLQNISLLRLLLNDPDSSLLIGSNICDGSDRYFSLDDLTNGSGTHIGNAQGKYFLDKNDCSNPPVLDSGGSTHLLAISSSSGQIFRFALPSTFISDIAYAASWNGVTTIAPSKNAVYDEMELRALDSAVVHDTGNESIDGVKTFTSDPIIPDEAYGVGWDGSLEPPTKNALYDKIETLAEITDLDNLKLDQFGITIDGGGAVFATGTKGYIRIPYSGTITGWTILEISATPVTCSVVVDVWKDTYANYPPTVADAVFTDKPTITTGIKGQNNAPAIVAGKEVVTAGDMFGYNVDSVTDAQKVAVLIHITKS